MSASNLFVTIADLDRATDATPGGYTTLYFMPIEGVSIIGPINPATGVISLLTTKAGYTYLRAYVPASGRQYDEGQEDSDAGPYMKMSIEAFYPFETLDAHLHINNMKQYKYLVLLSTTTPGFYRVLGNPENPVSFSHKFNSGRGFKNVPGTTLVFTWENEDKPLMRRQ